MCSHIQHGIKNQGLRRCCDFATSFLRKKRKVARFCFLHFTARCLHFSSGEVSSLPNETMLNPFHPQLTLFPWISLFLTLPSSLLSSVISVKVFPLSRLLLSSSCHSTFLSNFLMNSNDCTSVNFLSYVRLNAQTCRDTIFHSTLFFIMEWSDAAYNSPSEL